MTNWPPDQPHGRHGAPIEVGDIVNLFYGHTKTQGTERWAVAGLILRHNGSWWVELLSLRGDNRRREVQPNDVVVARKTARELGWPETGDLVSIVRGPYAGESGRVVRMAYTPKGDRPVVRTSKGDAILDDLEDFNLENRT